MLPPPRPMPPPEDLEAAGLGRRLGACLLDWTFIAMMAVAGAMVGGSILLAGTGSAESAAAAAHPTGLLQVTGAVIVLISFFALPFVYLGIGWRRGGTLGMRILGLRIVDARTGGRVSWSQVLLRYAGYWWSLVTISAGFVIAAFDGRRRTLGDRMAGSLILRSTPVPMAWVPGPSGWTAWPVRAPRPPPLDPTAPAPDEFAKVARSPWTWTDVVPVLLLLLPILFGVTYVVRLSAQGLSVGSGGRPLVSTLGDMAAYGASLLLVAALVRWRRHTRLSELGLRLPRWPWLVAGIPMAFAALILQAILGVISRAIFPNAVLAVSNQCVGIRSSFGGSVGLALVAVAVVAPVSEEIIFRGFTFRYLEGRLPLWIAVAVSAVIFSAAHAGWKQPSLFLPIFASGVLLAFLYAKSRSVWPGVIVHMTINTLATVVIFATPAC